VVCNYAGGDGGEEHEYRRIALQNLFMRHASVFTQLRPEADSWRGSVSGESVF